MRAGIAACREQGIGNFIPFIATALAETEAEAGEIEAALATIDGAIADGERTGQCWFDAESRRTRGDILLKRDPTNTAPAEEAFLTAIAIAQQQKARSFELRAALSLAKLYHSTGRDVDAHDILAPRWKVLRRRRKCRRSRRDKRCSPRSPKPTHGSLRRGRGSAG